MCWTLAEQWTRGVHVPQTDILLLLALRLASTCALSRGPSSLFVAFVFRKPFDPAPLSPLSKLVLFYPLPIGFKVLTNLACGLVFMSVLNFVTFQYVSYIRPTPFWYCDVSRSKSFRLPTLIKIITYAVHLVIILCILLNWWEQHWPRHHW